MSWEYFATLAAIVMLVMALRAWHKQRKRTDGEALRAGAEKSRADCFEKLYDRERERLGYIFAKGYSPIFDTVSGEWMMRDVNGGDIVRAKDPRALLDELLQRQATRADEYHKNKNKE